MTENTKKTGKKEISKSKGSWGGSRPNSGGSREGAGRKPNPQAETFLLFGDLKVKDTLAQIAKGELEVSPLQFNALKALLPYTEKKLGDGGLKDKVQDDAKDLVKRSKFTPSAAPVLVASDGRRVA